MDTSKLSFVGEKVLPYLNLTVLGYQREEVSGEEKRDLMNNGARLPNFIIVGAQKAGTTSMHHILNHHDDVFIPGREIYFFDIDDVQQHPDFSRDDSGKWTFHDYEYYWDDYLE
jgi:hypothetical protein